MRSYVDCEDAVEDLQLDKDKEQRDFEALYMIYRKGDKDDLLVERTLSDERLPAVVGLAKSCVGSEVGCGRQRLHWGGE